MQSHFWWCRSLEQHMSCQELGIANTGLEDLAEMASGNMRIIQHCLLVHLSCLSNVILQLVLTNCTGDR